MATKEEKQAETKRRTNQRRSLNDAYASILGERAIQTFSNYTFEDALDQQIERIEGADTKLRPNLLNKVTQVYEGVKKTVEELKSLDDSEFSSPVTSDENVNN